MKIKYLFTTITFLSINIVAMIYVSNTYNQKNKSIFFTNLSNEIPELYSKPCSYISRNLGACDGSSYKVSKFYDKTSGKSYISGYRAMLFGMPRYVYYEISSKGIRTLPKNKNTQRLFRADWKDERVDITLSIIIGLPLILFFVFFILISFDFINSLDDI